MAVGARNLDGGNALSAEESVQTRAVGTSSFNTGFDQLAQGEDPGQKLAVAGCRGRELVVAEEFGGIGVDDGDVVGGLVSIDSDDDVA